MADVLCLFCVPEEAPLRAEVTADEGGLSEGAERRPARVPAGTIRTHLSDADGAAESSADTRPPLCLHDPSPSGSGPPLERLSAESLIKTHRIIIMKKEIAFNRMCSS